MITSELVALIKQMVQEKKIGLFPRKLEDGTDLLVCPSCKKTTPGSVAAVVAASGSQPNIGAIIDGDHADNCQLARLQEALQRGAPDEEIVSRTTWLIRDGAIGLHGNQNSSRQAVCTACGTRSSVMTNHATYPLAAGQHHPTCEAVQLAEAIFS